MNWYVISTDAEEADHFVEAYGPLDNEADARAFAIDLCHDNGWHKIDVEYTTEESVLARTTKHEIYSAYK